MHMRLDESNEWIETDGLGGFATGTLTGVRTRRYHSILTSSTRPPTQRVALVKGFDAWIETPEGAWALTSHRYAPDVLYPDGAMRISAFACDPWPTWRYTLPSGLVVEHELVMRRGAPVVALSWRTLGDPSRLTLRVRPLLGATDYHALRREAASVRTEARFENDSLVAWRPDAALPEVRAATNAAYAHDPRWHRAFLYCEERARGFDHIEDLLSPGMFTWRLDNGEAVMILSAGDALETDCATSESVIRRFTTLRQRERARRAAFRSPLHKAADAYIVRRGAGKSIIAGYPWFADWGRDTFIAMRGLLLATGRLDDARDVLLGWSGAISGGMAPNRFPDAGETPEYNSVDASLWFIVVVREWMDAMTAAGREPLARDRGTLQESVRAILDAYTRGARHGIGADADGLLAAGEHGVQLTWTDARVGDHVVTPRIGKPVEVQALWINALAVGAGFDPSWRDALARARRSFTERFWNEEAQCLYDVIDRDHVRGAVDPSIRPNQIFAVGGLPLTVLDARRARAVVDVVDRTLRTPLGLRSLAPGAPGYTPRYEGGPDRRDGAYHQGTVWPWLMGPFIEAWLRTRTIDDDAALAGARMLLEPLRRHIDEGGIGHVCEIADAEPPRHPRGCPFQAWSVGELLRVGAMLERDAGGIHHAESPSMATADEALETYVVHTE